MKQHWTEKQKKRRRRIDWTRANRVIYLILFLFFISVTAYAFMFSGFLNVTTIEINGNIELTKVEVFENINTLLGGNKIKILARRNYLFINERKLSEQIKNHFKRIDSIEITKIFPNKLQVNIKERAFILVICVMGDCYLVDKQGVAYARADFTKEELYKNRIVKLLDESGNNIEEGATVLRPELVEFATSIVKKIEESTNLRLLNEYRLRSRAVGEIVIQTNRGWDIYTDYQHSPEETVRILKTVLSKQLSLQDLNNLEYIDLRAGNKVFYRLKGDGGESVE